MTSLWQFITNTIVGKVLIGKIDIWHTILQVGVNCQSYRQSINESTRREEGEIHLQAMTRLSSSVTNVNGTLATRV
jgi:hypothetical protein